MRTSAILKISGLALSLTIAGCALQFRNVKYLPRPLKVMQFTSAANINANLTSTLYQQFKAMGVKWVKNKNAVNFNITSDSITYTDSNIVDSNVPNSYTFTESTTFEIDYKGHVIYGPSTLVSSTTLTMTPQSIYAGGTTNVVRQQLNNNIIVLLYNALTAESSKQAITKAYEAAKKS